MRYLLICIISLISLSSVGQAPNDDCSTATDLGVLDLSWSGGCFDGTIYWSTMAFDSNAIASPSIPYYSMNGCLGYTTSTTTNADDIWYKFGSWIHTIKFRVYSNDTVHINFYYGTGCSSLLPSRCFTYQPSYTDTSIEFYASTDTINEYNYIQLSGVSPGDDIEIVFCMKTWTLSTAVAYGTININTGLFNDNFNEASIKSMPNPATDLITLSGNIEMGSKLVMFDLLGNEIFNQTFDKDLKQYSICAEKLSSGIYFWKVISRDRDTNGKIIVTK